MSEEFELDDVKSMVHAGGAELPSRALTCVLRGKPRAGMRFV